jgi:ubiquinone/menaquinone biosynthesis C-methylase UbiE
MNLSEINIREKEFHNKLQSKNNGRFENIFYKALHNLYVDFYDFLEKNSESKIILDYGCGIGSVTEKVARQKPSKIVGADISDVSINKAIESAKEANIKIEYRVENCESLNFESQTFDLIYGTGILHHLNLKTSANEINRLLKKNGKMVFMEPLGTNPLINIYRKLTPNSRSVDEHPFINSDFKFLKTLYGELEIRYYGFLTLLFFPFYNKPEKSRFYKFLAAIDQKIFRFKFLRFLAWSVLIVGKKV